MKASELKEVFDIFITKLDENKEIMDANHKMFEATQILAEEKNKILSAIDNKSDQIANYKPHVTYSVPELENFKEDQKVLLAEAKQAISKMFDNHIKDLDSTYKRNKDDKGKLYFLIAFLVLLFFNFGFLSYGLNQNKQKNDFKALAKSFRRTADTRLKFIEEKKLEAKYKKWLDNQP